VLVAGLLSDAVAVRGEEVAERVAVGLEQRPDLVERQLECPEAADGDRGLDLRCVVVAIAAVRIDLRRHEQPDLVVVAERFHRQSGGVRESSDAQHAARMQAPPRGESNA
jgi:hypothetical protein